MKIYIDSKFYCHAENDGSMREFESNFFDGKCKELIEGYSYIPSGEVFIKDGIRYIGEQISPHTNLSELLRFQSAYEDGQRNILSEVEGVLGL